MKIEDDFLDQEQFDTIIKRMEEPIFHWSYNDNIDNESDVDKFQFTHLFYLSDRPGSNAIQIVSPLLASLKPISIYRIKANLLTRTSKIVENEFHTDMGVLSEEKQKQWTTSIFYVNTNNGYTKFEDGTKVESVANRLVTFPTNIKHTGTSCTDEKKRIVINFNYYI
tara:strand:- start:29 stop:529 length:501 start_codon:yes stop_codon:yes gene_type:complete